MRMRHSTGGVRKQRGRWIGLWWEQGTKKSRVLGFAKDMTKGEAREAVARIVAVQRETARDRVWTFGEYVEQKYFGFYTQKWKASTRETNMNRIRVHLMRAFGGRELSSFRRDELQDLLVEKAKRGFSFSVVAHLRWDLKHIFDLAVGDGQVRLNPARILFIPKEAAKPVRLVMTGEEVQTIFAALDQRERLIAKLAVIAGMRPGEIFALTWGRLTDTYADIRQRVYRGKIDTPKTYKSIRQAALSEGLIAEIEGWRKLAADTRDGAWVFPSERLTPLSKDNCWRRDMHPKLAPVGLGWCNFQVMRRTHATLMKQEVKADPKSTADQLGHTVDVSLNEYTQTSVESRQALVNQLEKSLRVN